MGFKLARACVQMLKKVPHPTPNPRITDQDDGTPQLGDAKIIYQWGNGIDDTVGDIITIILNVKHNNGSVQQNFNYMTYSFGTKHRLQSISSQTPPAGYQYDYANPDNDYSNQVTVTLPDNSVRQFTFNADGYLTKDSRAHGATFNGNSIQEDTTYTRNTLDQITQFVDAENVRTSYTYDARGNVLTVTRKPLSGTTSATTRYTYEQTF